MGTVLALLLSVAIVTSWPAATPGFGPVPVSVERLRTNDATPAARSSSRVALSRTIGLPVIGARSMNGPVELIVKAPLFVRLTPSLVNDPLSKLPDASTVKVPLLTVGVVALLVAAPMSMVPLG